jgi:hypothetical protein
LGNQSGTTYNPGTLTGDTTYYWRIDEVNGYGTTTGAVWSFTATSLSSDFYSDTWVAVDALGRGLPDYNQTGAPRADRTVGLFYFLTAGTLGPCDTAWDNQGPWDITKILAANPSSPAWGPSPCTFPQAGAAHFWGEPEMGYYLSNDQWVMRKHAYMLANAGVDVIIFDISNAYTYTDRYMAVCSVFEDIRAHGGKTPQICFFANWNADGNVQSVYDNLYSQGLYSDLWFYWKGKPLVVAPLQGASDPAGGTINYSSAVQSFFNFRYAWADTAGQDTWNWIAYYPQAYGWHESSSIPEEISISCGRHPNANPGKGRSFHNNSQPAINQYALTGTEDRGFMFAEEWNRLTQIDPEFVWVTGWNEWTAGRFVIPTSGPYAGNYPFLNGTVGPGGTLFVDAYSQEFSRDVEPMKDGHTDNYYYQMIDGIRRYKGVRTAPTVSAAKTIAIDGNFTDWNGVTPIYRDWAGDAAHRNSTGWGTAGTYVDNAGRNDFVAAKAARDNDYVYFYIQTDANITSYTDPNWMVLLIDADQNNNTGWYGFDYAINLSIGSSTNTTLMSYGGFGWSWNNLDTTIPYRVSGNMMEIGVPRSEIGQGSGSARVALDFKWADNFQSPDNIIRFAVSSDSAPDGRFKYRYDTSPWTQLTYDSFESGFGNYTDGGANCSRYTGCNYAHHGMAAIKIQAGGGDGASFYHTSGLDVSAYSQIKVEFWYYPTGMESGKSFLVDYYNGSSWQTVATYTSGTDFNNDSFYQVNGTKLILTNVLNYGTYTFPTNAKFKFRCNASDPNDDVYIDEVKISAR